MASSYTSNIKLEKPASGDQVGTWDTTLRNNWDLQDEAICGHTTQAITSADVTLTMDATTCVARHAVIELTGTSTAARNLIVPAVDKTWVIYNNTTGGYDHTVKVSGQTGVVVPNGKKMLLYCDGTDVREAMTYSSGFLTTAGATMTGPINFPAATTSIASWRAPHGTAPSSPTNGDFWTTTSAAFIRINGASKTFAFTDSNITGSAATLTTARNISCTGDATWTVSFNGSANATAALTLANSGVSAGSYTNANITVDAKGRITSAASGSSGGGGSTTYSLTANSGGAGDASGMTFNGSAAKTISYNTIGAAPTASPTFTGTITGAAMTLSGTATLNGNSVIGSDSSDTCTVNAVTTFANTVNFNGPTNLGNASSDTVTVVGHADFQNNVTLGASSADTVTVHGTTTFNNDVTLGSSSADTITFNGTPSGLAVAAAWCYATQSVGTWTVQRGSNVSSITTDSTGKFTVTLSSALSSVDYAVVATPTITTSGDVCFVVVEESSKTTSAFQLWVKDPGNNFEQPRGISFIVYV